MSSCYKLSTEKRFKTVSMVPGQDSVYPSRDQRFLRDLDRAIEGDMVFIIGESGSGKTWLAKHIAKKRKNRFVQRVLSTTRDDFLEAELKGIEKGQLDSQHKGLRSVFESLTPSTTLFFDEFGHLSKAGQRLFYPVISSRTLGQQLAAKELVFDQGQLIFALDYWHERPDEQLINRILQHAVVLVLPDMYHPGFADMDLVFESVFKMKLEELQLNGGAYDASILEYLHHHKPENGLRGLYQQLTQCDVTRPLTLERWKASRIAINRKRRALSAMSKQELRDASYVSEENADSQSGSRSGTQSGSRSGTQSDLCREHVLKEIERSFSFEGDEDVVRELDFLKECEVLEASGQLIRPVKKKLVLFLYVLDLCHMYPTLEEQALHYYMEGGSGNRPQNEVESFRKLKKRRTVPGFTLDQLSALKSDRYFEHIKHSKHSKHSEYIEHMEHSERMLAAIKQHFQLFSSDDFLMKLICDEKSRLLLQR